MNRPTSESFRIASFPFVFLLLVLFTGTADAAAPPYKAETFSAPPPEELATPVRETLANDAIRIVGPNGPLCEIWWRKSVPTESTPDQGLGIAYPSFGEGTMFGAMRIVAQTADYRKQQIKPGVYTMRYALIPVDGNHQGVAPNRDFLLLVPAAADPSPATITAKDLIGLSRKASGTGHPSVWSLPQVDSPPNAVPSLLHQEDSDTWVLYLRVPLARGDGLTSPLVMALVVVGHAPEA